MKLVYVASAYSHEDPAIRESRFEAVCRYAAHCMARGEFVFSPIAHTHPIALAGELPTDWKFWREYDEGMIERCQELRVLMLDGWRESKGIAEEINMALAEMIPVTYVRPFDDHYTKPAPSPLGPWEEEPTQAKP